MILLCTNLSGEVDSLQSADAGYHNSNQTETMTLANAIKKIEKAGFTVEQFGNTYRASKLHNPRVIEFFKNGSSEEICCLNVRHLADQHDSMTDYFAGTWARNLKQALALAIS